MLIASLPPSLGRAMIASCAQLSMQRTQEVPFTARQTLEMLAT
jgi:hypothetical protein